jgi:hypothetical protein
MQTITQKKKLSKGTWVLIFLGIAALITFIVLAAVGIIPVNFLTDPYDMETGTSGLLVAYAMFGTASWINAAIMIVLPLLAGMVFMWIIYRWFKGQTVTVATAGQSSYTPQTGASASAASGTTTEIN